MNKKIIALGLLSILAQINSEILKHNAFVSEFSDIDGTEPYFIVACQDCTDDIRVHPFAPGNVDHNSVVVYSKNYLENRFNPENIKYYFEENLPIGIALICQPKEVITTFENFTGEPPKKISEVQVIDINSYELPKLSDENKATIEEFTEEVKQIKAKSSKADKGSK